MIEAREAYAPESLENAVAAMRELSHRAMRVGFVGGSTHASLGNVPSEPYDALVHTSGLGRVVDYAPADQTITVEAGMTFARLAAHLAPNGQRFALESFDPEHATIGGAIATNAYGPRRARYGSAKDLIVGVTIIRADGTVARGGGKVVKNVAGFDIPKLVVGSLGTLALITAATFRVHPLPESTRVVRFQHLSAAAVWDLTLAMRAAQLEPAAFVAIRSTRPAYAATVTFEGFTAAVDAQVERLTAIAHERGWRCDPLDERGAKSFDDDHRFVRRGAALRLKATMLPSDLIDFDAKLAPPLLETFEDVRLVVYPALGVAFVGADVVAPSRSLAWAVGGDGRAALVRAGGTLVIEAAPPEMLALDRDGSGVDAWGEDIAAFRLMEALKDRFDPERRLNPGRFIRGL